MTNYKKTGLNGGNRNQALTHRDSNRKQAANIMNEILPSGVAIQLQLVSHSVYAEWQSSGTRTSRELRRWIKRKQAGANP